MSIVHVIYERRLTPFVRGGEVVVMILFLRVIVRSVRKESS